MYQQYEYNEKSQCFWLNYFGTSFIHIWQVLILKFSLLKYYYNQQYSTGSITIRTLCVLYVNRHYDGVAVESQTFPTFPKEDLKHKFTRKI